MNDDVQWRRPAGAAPGRPDPGSPDAAPAADPAPEYTGPPRATPPPPDWRPRTLIEAPPPRPLPGQDASGLDAEEREARIVTYGVGMVAGAVLLIVLFVLCGRALF